MSITLDLQVACENNNLPHRKDFQLWVNTALSPYKKKCELTVRIVESDESQSLNNQYRHKNKPTNVLSFPFEVPEGIELNLLGDLIICADVVIFEAEQQQKDVKDHWAHMIIHGCLHLLGYDHINHNEAQEMEAIEIERLTSINICDPYQVI